MTKRYRDAGTGKWTTAADAAARKAETVSETVPARHETPDVAELRRLAEACPGFILKYLGGGPGVKPYITLADESGMPLSDSGWDAVLLFAEIAAQEVPRLLDRLAHMTEARDNARAEVERLGAAVERVREMHERESFWQYHRDQEHSYLTREEAADDSGCDCPDTSVPFAPFAHTPECLATISHFDVCSECARIEYADAGRQAHGEFSGYAEALWPCPTIRALDATLDGEAES